MEERYPWIAVYMLSNRYRGTLYLGVTSDLINRIHQHREGVFEGFSKDHGLHRLVWFEAHGAMTTAIQTIVLTAPRATMTSTTWPASTGVATARKAPTMERLMKISSLAR